jgi:hypothetical protein
MPEVKRLLRRLSVLVARRDKAREQLALYVSAVRELKAELAEAHRRQRQAQRAGRVDRRKGGCP